jgi:hypothetical protein
MATFYHLGRGVTGIVTRESRECGDCGVAHFVFLNRDGVTRCLACDGEYVRRVRAISDEMFAEAMSV